MGGRESEERGKCNNNKTEEERRKRRDRDRERKTQERKRDMQRMERNLAHIHNKENFTERKKEKEGACNISSKFIYFHEEKK